MRFEIGDTIEADSRRRDNGSEEACLRASVFTFNQPEFEEI